MEVAGWSSRPAPLVWSMDLTGWQSHALGAETLTGRVTGALRSRNPKAASERVSEREGLQRFSEVFRISEIFRGFQRFSEVFQRPSQSPSQSAVFPSEMHVLLPLIVLPLKV